MDAWLQDIAALGIVGLAALYLTQRIVGSPRRKRGARAAPVQLGDRLARGLKSAKKDR
jgi:hypothetical protein